MQKKTNLGFAKVTHPVTRKSGNGPQSNILSSLVPSHCGVL